MEKRYTALMATGAQAEPRIYPYASATNYCPNGLQPITINGVICCGTPNQSVSYQQAMAHPVRAARKGMVRRVASTYCPEGEKGCVSQ